MKNIWTLLSQHRVGV